MGIDATWIPVNKERMLKSATDFSCGVVRSVSSGSKKALDSAASGSQKALDSTAAVSREAWKSASVSAAGLMSVTQGILASTISADLGSMLAGLAKGPATIYDKAMDAGYLATNIGGGNHRLFDGGTPSPERSRRSGARQPRTASSRKASASSRGCSGT